MKSYMHQPSTRPVLETTIDEHLRDCFHRNAQCVAIVDDRSGCRWTYRELDDNVCDQCDYLCGCGFKKGDRIALLSENTAQYVSILLACLREEITVVSLNSGLAPHSIEERMRIADAHYLLISETAFNSIGMSPAFVATGLEFGPSMRVLALVHAHEMLPALDCATCDGVEIHAACMIFFSSGTTAEAKAIALTHRNLLNNATLVGHGLNYRPGQRVLSLFPFSVAGGAVIGVLAVLASGATIVCAQPGQRRADIINALNRHQPNFWMASPRIVEEVFDDFPGDLDFLVNLKCIGMGSTPCLPKFINKLILDCAVPEVFLLYGMTETSPITFMQAIQEPIAGDVAPLGRLLDHLEAKIVDEDGQTVQPGDLGELCIRGHATMAGYWNNPVATASTIDAFGWLHTGDLARLDLQGAWYLFGRKNERIDSETGKLHPCLLEHVFLKHDNVLNAQVVCLPDKRLVAWVKPDPRSKLTPESLGDYYRSESRGLPSISCIRLVESFPLNDTGKVQRTNIVQQMIKELGLAHV